MSDEESFVILGSSPMSSLEADTIETRETAGTPLESDTPGSRFSSLKNSQISDLKNAQESATQTQNYLEMQPTNSSPLNHSINISNGMQETKDKNEEIAASKLWSTTAPQDQLEENMVPSSLEDCALKSPLEQQQQKAQQESMLNGEQPNKKTSCPADGSLAASFIMGEIDSDILKTSVYSQFPSISLEACAEDVVKLQNMVTEYSQLKSMIKKANTTMKLFYQNSLQWKQKMQTMEEDYKQELNNCKQEIAELRKQNNEMDKNFQTQIEALEIARKKDLEEYIQEISEKSSLLENMRAQIIKLEEIQFASFDMMSIKEEQQQANKGCKSPQLEHELKIKDLQRQLSELLASNLDLKDVEKQYLDELNCLRVNLTAAEELIAKNHSEIVQLQSLNMEKDREIQALETTLKSLGLMCEEQKERIGLLETQNEVHRTDFELEKQSRETALKEKQQMLQDLRSLQKRNQELIEEQQKLADNYQKKISSSVAASIDSKLNAASAAAETYFNNPQRPIRILPSPSTPNTPSLHMCPICNKGFKSLNILLSHVDDCADKN